MQGRGAARRAVLLALVGLAAAGLDLLPGDRADAEEVGPTDLTPRRRCERDDAGLRRLLEDLAYEPEPGDLCRLEPDAAGEPPALDDAALRRTRWRVALGLRGGIAAMTSQDRLDYLAGRRPAPEVVEAWVWLPEPRPARAALPEEAPPALGGAPPHPPAATRRSSQPTAGGPGDPAQDGLQADRWGPEPTTPYSPVRIVPRVERGRDGHTRSAWVRDPAAQARRFLERQAQNAALGGGDWLRRDDGARAPLPPLRDARGHTRSRYAGGAPSPADQDAIVRDWGRETLERVEREEGRSAAPRPLPSLWDTLRAATRGGRG